MPLPWRRIYLCVALTTLGMLLLELSLTRIFSVVFYYHFAFLAISIALFGLGVGGVLSYVAAGWRGNLFAKLAWLSLAGSLSVILAVATLVLGGKELTNAWLAWVYFATSLPFIFGGMILSLIISETIERVDRVYFFDLLGAAAGCLLLTPLLNLLGGPNTALAAAILFAVAGAAWQGLPRLAPSLLVLAISGFLIFSARYRLLDVRYAKEGAISDEIFVQWNSFSRVSVKKEKGWDNPAILIDSDANTGIPNLNIDRLTEVERRLVLQMRGQGLPYLLRPGAKALVIGPGGGWDIVLALLSGSKDVTGVEINPIIADTVMRGRFVKESHGLYLRREVRIVVEDGRSFVRRSPDKYQVLQATMVDTWASTAAGAFALSENNLYTTDAFVDYLSHLTDDGLMVFTRWGFEPPRESLRIVSLAIEALRGMGEGDPAKHVIVVREGSREQLQSIGAQDTVLISRKPFSPEDIKLARASLAESKLDAVYFPGESIPNEFTAMLLSRDVDAFQRGYRYDVTPVGDNRPFFFYTVQPRDMWAFLQGSRDAVDFKINRAVPMLFGLMGISVAATLLILALPPLVLGARLPREKGVLSFLPYFICAGAGFMLVEVALIQKFVLFLGSPAYALTVILFAMLVSSGLGSYFSRRFLPSTPSLLLLAGWIALLAAALNPLLGSAVGMPFWLKIAMTLTLIFPLGFLMGMPFPRGLKLLQDWHSPSVRWAWSLNAASSVLGSAGAIFCALYMGLKETLLIGGSLYLVALLVERASRAPHGRGGETQNIGARLRRPG